MQSRINFDRCLHVFALTQLLVALGCSSSSEAEPSSTPNFGNSTTPPQVVTDAGATTSSAVDSGPSEPSCSGEKGCYKCAPAKLEHFLNRCGSSQCTPFDNATRVPQYKGTLPAIP